MEGVRLLYEDPDFLIVEKPANLLVHRARISDELTLVDWLLKRYPEIGEVGDDPRTRPGIVHRLDRDTSGVMVVARTQVAFEFLKKLFQEGKAKKTYVALVWGAVQSLRGEIHTPIGLKSGSVRRATQGKKLRLMKEARTRYKVLQRLSFEEEQFTLLAVYPETGRTHQIRVHLQSIGHSVVGDQVYGTSKTIRRLAEQIAKKLGIDRQFLHAESIEFTTPQGSRLKVSADLPPRLARALDLLSRGAEDPPRNN